MALSAATVWECRASGASDNNGGGFVAGSGGTDRSQQNAAQVAVGGGVVTSSVTTNVITFTGGTYTVLAGDVGNIVQVISGTNATAGFYQITSVTAGLNGTWTMDSNVVTAGTATNLVANMGGALATLGKLAGAMIASNRAYCTGAFTATATTTFAQTVVPAGGTPQTRLVGYGATRGDTGQATLTLQTNTGLTGVNATGSGFSVEQISVDCGSLGTSSGVVITGTYSEIRNCKVANFTLRGFYLNNSDQLIQDVEATGGTAAATAAIVLAGGREMLLRGFVHDNACPGIVGQVGAQIIRCLIVNNSGASSDGIQAQYNVPVTNCTIHNNGRDGLRATTPNPIALEWRNNIFSNNGGYGITGSSGTAIPAAPGYDGNAFYNNTSGARNLMDSTAGIYGLNPYTNTRDVTLSVSPYVGGTTGTTANFALNNTAGGGAACRAAGSPSTWPGNTGTTGYLDMGAVQHQDTGGGGGVLFNPSLEGV